MAQLGVATFDELIGRVDLLDPRAGGGALESERNRSFGCAASCSRSGRGHAGLLSD
ncbi:MAG: hypothetical protein Ct9H300mP16_09170 [Pseudomonadota bacterium]|nr:MAG: hypothetical protein Ct9H300mP16_09170 [Pseudomonadota bacterium]